MGMCNRVFPFSTAAHTLSHTNGHTYTHTHTHIYMHTQRIGYIRLMHALALYSVHAYTHIDVINL